MPDVRTDTLKPELIIPQQTPQISIPIEPIPVQSISNNEKKDELLLNVNEEELIEHGSHTSNKILDDLNDLHFEENDKNKDETESEGKKI